MELLQMMQLASRLQQYVTEKYIFESICMNKLRTRNQQPKFRKQSICLNKFFMYQYYVFLLFAYNFAAGCQKSKLEKARVLKHNFTFYSF